MTETNLGHDTSLAFTYRLKDIACGAELINNYMESVNAHSKYFPTEGEVDLLIRARAWEQDVDPSSKAISITSPTVEEIGTLWSLLLNYNEHNFQQDTLIWGELGADSETYGKIMKMVAKGLGPAIAMYNEQEVAA